MEVRDHVFVVTGGGNGIGREVVLELLRRGARVAAVDLRPDGLEETAGLAAAGERLSLHAADVGDRERVGALPDEVLAAHDRVDGLLNVAGIIQRFVPVADLEWPDMDKVVTVNFWGTVATCKAFLPHLLARPAAAILNVSSMGGLAPVPGQTVYGASKAAVKLFTEGLYAELRGTPVAVTGVFPGGVATNITANSGVEVPAGAADAASSRMPTTTPQDAAKQIVVGLEKGAYRVVVGKDARGLDLMSRIAPRRATDLVAKKMAALLGT